MYYHDLSASNKSRRLRIEACPACPAEVLVMAKCYAQCAVRSSNGNNTTKDWANERPSYGQQLYIETHWPKLLISRICYWCPAYSRPDR